MVVVELEGSADTPGSTGPEAGGLNNGQLAAWRGRINKSRSCWCLRSAAPRAIDRRLGYF